MIEVAGPTTENPMPAGSVALHVALAVAASWILQLAAIDLWGLESEGARLAFVTAMWSPTLIALAFMVFHRPAQAACLGVSDVRYGSPLGSPLKPLSPSQRAHPGLAPAVLSASRESPPTLLQASPARLTALDHRKLSGKAPA